MALSIHLSNAGYDHAKIIIDNKKSCLNHWLWSPMVVVLSERAAIIVCERVSISNGLAKRADSLEPAI